MDEPALAQLCLFYLLDFILPAPHCAGLKPHRTTDFSEPRTPL
jgi:hypothetical protein